MAPNGQATGAAGALQSSAAMPPWPEAAREGADTVTTGTSAEQGAAGQGAAGQAAPQSRSLTDPYLYLNREVSWLQFNDRVLALATDPATPLLERLKFLSIFSTNLDEFFMVRVSGLREQVEAGVATRGSDGWTPTETLEAIGKHVVPAIEAQARCFLDEMVPALAAEGIRLAAVGELDRQDRDYLREYFLDQVFPVLTPLADDSTFVPLEQVVTAHLGQLFPGMTVVEAHPFRVTRDADIEAAEDEADDLLIAVEQELRRRRFGAVVRLEVAASMPEHIVRLLRRELDVDDDAVVSVE